MFFLSYCFIICYNIGMNTNQTAILNNRAALKSAAKEFLIIFSGALFIAITAHIRVPLPFSPVPVTMQTFSIFILGAFLGRKAFFCALLYLMGGTIGLPIFAGAMLFGPTGGYLLAFPFAAFAVGYISEKEWKNSFLKYFVAILFAEIIIFTAGLLWLGRFVGFNSVLHLGLYPFVLGEIFKVFLTASILPQLMKYRKK